MTEQDKKPSFEERLAACPIHQWADVDGYLERAQVSQHLWRPFHELVLVRGELPKNMSPEQGKSFGKEAVDIAHRYEILPTEGHAMKTIFGQLIEQWLAQGAKYN